MHIPLNHFVCEICVVYHPCTLTQVWGRKNGHHFEGNIFLIYLPVELRRRSICFVWVFMTFSFLTFGNIRRLDVRKSNETGRYFISGPLHIEAKTKWPPFSRRYFEMDFLEWSCMHLDLFFIKICSQGSNDQYSSVGSENGLATSQYLSL